MVKIRSVEARSVKLGAGLRRKSRPAGKRLRLVQEAGAEEQTRERIIRVATALFYERGYRGTSLAAIARQVGISAPALYWHFSSKREVCFIAVYEELNRFLQSLKTAAQGPSPSTQLARFVRSYVLLKLKQNEWLREPGAAGTYRQLHQALTQSQKERVNALQRQAFDLLRTILADGRQAGTFIFDDLTATTFAVITLCEYVFAWVRPGGRLTPDAVADIYQRLVLAMVGGKAS